MVEGMNGLFVEEFSGWDQVTDFDIQLYDAKLSRNLAAFKAGDVVDAFIGFWYGKKPVVEIYHEDKVYTIDIRFDKLDLDRWSVKDA